MRPCHLLAALIPLLLGAATGPTIVDPGFEDDPSGWTINDQMSRRSRDQAASGQWSLLVVDTSDKDGSDALSKPFPVKPRALYEVRCRVYPVSGSGLGIYVRLLDEKGAQVKLPEPILTQAPATPGEWRPVIVHVQTTPETRAAQVWLHSYSHAIVSAYVDEFSVAELNPAQPAPPLWPPQYKLRPGETDRLTAADVVGPDGLVYPDFTSAGVPGGIPRVPVKVRARDFGALPNDDRDDADALEAALAAAGAGGGGAVELEAGRYHLDRSIAIKRDGVVLRGQGAARTEIIYRYNLGPEGVKFATPQRGDDLWRDSEVTFHASPTRIAKIELLVGDKSITTATTGTHWGNRFWLSTSGSRLIDAVAADARTVTVTGVATYTDGTQRKLDRTYTIQRTGSDPEEIQRASVHAAICFAGEGRHWKSTKIKLAADGRRGDTSLTLESTAGLAPGDWIVIDGPATERWKSLTQNKCLWGTYRMNILQLQAVEGNRVTLSQPLRIEFPVIDGSQVYKINPLRGGGIEDLTIEQTENLWITTVEFRAAVGCWARGVTVKKCGRNGIYGYLAKHCTIADCLLDDAWFKGGGGTAYAGWEHSFDCLMTDCEVRKYRHAPCVQWAASGNVIRRSKFVDSDAQWHSGWTNENLFEQCEVIANTGNGAYGYGAWASPPEDTAHGPNGPRNVVYNCDISSPRTGLWMGGMNENWLILYNRFRVRGGNGVFAKTYSFDHIIRGNVFALADGRSPALQLQTGDCSGVEFYDNTVYTDGGRLLGGLSLPAVERNNTLQAYLADPPRPTPAVPSIYEWQLQHARHP